ncbi:hypothetical protein [Ideonella oryzae]|uniref:TonB C-terminal domain-containing protein n=1 Tax=Ideonella oryzae TaxID=2937441 RepID=A0ABT1BKS7_9BURK|nr:hypothetical protein [Ideonella oryzae]MCO5976718.1 hypothetical protein [Ideonella oryzae]
MATVAILLASCGAPTPQSPSGAGGAPGRPAAPTVSPQAPARSWAEYQVRAAQRMVAANPDRTYMGPVDEPLLAIPVLEIELKADGEIARINVKREPRQAKDTIQLAIDAVRRGAPYGDVRQLPKPWKFTEVFLFNDDRQFKPRTLDD